MLNRQKYLAVSIKSTIFAAREICIYKKNHPIVLIGWKTMKKETTFV